MYMKVFPHGQGNGSGPTHYLVRPDYPGRDERPPEVLRGDVETTCDLIDSLDTKWKFTAGVLSWHPDDTVTPKQEKRVMDDFEAVAFAGLEPDQRNILWVRHSHADHHELHFVIPRVELGSGKAFNPCPPGWQKQFDVFRDLHNHREDWARPDDPARARLHTPEHADLHKARLLRWGKTPRKDERAEAKAAIHEYLRTCIGQGTVTSRADVLTALQGAGLEINRAGKDYITVKDPESGEKLRLKGGIYAEHWKLEHPGRAHEGQDGTGTPRDGKPDPATVRRLEQELGRIIEKRAQYNRGRYPQRYHGHGNEHHLSLSKPGQDVRPEILAVHPPECGHPAADHVGLLGADDVVSAPHHGLATGTLHTPEQERDSGERHSRDSDAFQRTDPISSTGQRLSTDAGRLENHSRGHGRQTGRLEHSEEISHDRTGTHPQKYLAHPGARIDRHAEGAQRIAGQPPAQSGKSRPGHPPATGENRPTPDRTSRISAALATLERYTRELGTALVALERLVERQIERIRERELEQQRQHSRGPGLGR